MTDVRKAANRINFMQPEEEFMDGDEVCVCVRRRGAGGRGGALRYKLGSRSEGCGPACQRGVMG